MVRTNVQETAENGGTYQHKNQTTHPQMTFFLSAWCDFFFRKICLTVQMKNFPPPSTSVLMVFHRGDLHI